MAGVGEKLSVQDVQSLIQYASPGFRVRVHALSVDEVQDKMDACIHQFLSRVVVISDALGTRQVTSNVVLAVLSEAPLHITKTHNCAVEWFAGYVSAVRPGYHFTDQALALLQQSIERYMVKWLAHSIQNTQHARRKTLEPRDMSDLPLPLRKHSPRYLRTIVSFVETLQRLAFAQAPEGWSDQVSHLLNLLLYEVMQCGKQFAATATISRKAIESAIRYLIPSDLARHALAFQSTHFSPRMIRKIEHIDRVDETGMAMLLGVMEYVATELRTINTAALIQGDADLSELFESIGVYAV